MGGDQKKASAFLKLYVRGGRQFDNWRPWLVARDIAHALPDQKLPVKASLDQEVWSEVCHVGLGCVLDRVSYPGGEDRKAVRLHLDDGSTLIATVRPLATATLEAFVLARLQGQNTSSPVLKYQNRMLSLQSDLGEDRLSARLRSSAPDFLGHSVESLARLQMAGSKVGLDDDMPETGQRDWLDGLLQQPAALGDILSFPAPQFDLVFVEGCLRNYRRRFVRWDARPGNAMVLAPHDVGWFDFESAGVRARLDDLVWLLADENVPDDVKLEEEILSACLADFADGLSLDQARTYVLTYGVLHSVVRAIFILVEKGKLAWTEYEDGVVEDRAMIEKPIMFRLCGRAARWARDVPELSPLAPWLQEMTAYLPD